MYSTRSTTYFYQYTEKSLGRFYFSMVYEFVNLDKYNKENMHAVLNFGWNHLVYTLNKRSKENPPVVLESCDVLGCLCFLTTTVASSTSNH